MTYGINGNPYEHEIQQAFNPERVSPENPAQYRSVRQVNTLAIAITRTSSGNRSQPGSATVKPSGSSDSLYSSQGSNSSQESSSSQESMMDSTPSSAQGSNSSRDSTPENSPLPGEKDSLLWYKRREQQRKDQPRKDPKEYKGFISPGSSPSTTSNSMTITTTTQVYHSQIIMPLPTGNWVAKPETKKQQ